MSTRSEEFSGLTVAMITPFRDGQVDVEALQRQVEFQIQAGTTCVCPVGTTGECPTLSHAEHERVISAVVEAAAGRIKVMAGTGSNSTDEALELTRWAAKARADAALIVAPYYNKPTQEGFYQHFRVLAQAVDIPICVYNIPGRTGKNIEPETIIRMAELPNITMVKEATGSLDQASQIIDATDLTVLSGDDSLTLPLLADRRPRRGLGRGQHRSQGRDRDDSSLRGGRPRRGAALASQALPALPRHAGAFDQSHSHQGGHADARPRHGRFADAAVPAQPRRRGEVAGDAGHVRAAEEVAVGRTNRLRFRTRIAPISDVHARSLFPL